MPRCPDAKEDDAPPRPMIEWIAAETLPREVPKAELPEDQKKQLHGGEAGRHAEGDLDRRTHVSAGGLWTASSQTSAIGIGVIQTHLASTTKHR